MLLFSEIDAIMSKLKRSGNSFDEFGYEDHAVLCNCGLRASRRILHTSYYPNRKFFGCAIYKSKDAKGCIYFEWYDVKVMVAVVYEKFRFANVVESLKNKVQDLRLDNLELQALINGNGDHAATSEINNTEIYTLRKILLWIHICCFGILLSVT
ncbi:hypothetical protein LINGRAHAP2_LOCUS4797 [Linum grandiflorum]